MKFNLFLIIANWQEIALEVVLVNILYFREEKNEKKVQSKKWSLITNTYTVSDMK